MSNRHARCLRLSAAIAFCAVTMWSQAVAQVQTITPPASETEKPAPYDDRLGRLSELIGAIHYLRNLCNAQGEPEWRQSLSELLDRETSAEPKRRARLTAAYNRGYRSFASVYTTCTAAAVRAEENYRNEGATLAAEITARYGN